jgi:hypothetical protein
MPKLKLTALVREGRAPNRPVPPVLRVLVPVGSEVCRTRLVLDAVRERVSKCVRGGVRPAKVRSRLRRAGLPGDRSSDEDVEGTSSPGSVVGTSPLGSIVSNSPSESWLGSSTCPGSDMVSSLLVMSVRSSSLSIHYTLSER